jgi:hypothetical protein
MESDSFGHTSESASIHDKWTEASFFQYSCHGDLERSNYPNPDPRLIIIGQSGQGKTAILVQLAQEFVAVRKSLAILQACSSANISNKHNTVHKLPNNFSDWLSQRDSPSRHTSPLSLDDLHTCIDASATIIETDEQSEQPLTLPPLSELHDRLFAALQEQQSQFGELLLLKHSSAALEAYLAAAEDSAYKRTQTDLQIKFSEWFAGFQVRKGWREEGSFRFIRQLKAIIRQLKALIRCLLNMQLINIASQGLQQIVYIRRYTSQGTRQDDGSSHLTHLCALWSNYVLFETTPGDATCLI